MRERNTAERIVFEFEHNVTETHRAAVEVTLGLTAEQFDAAIGRARDLGVECDPPLRLTPVYERDGWWTARPTERIMAIAVEQSLRRNLGEQVRSAHVLTGTRLDGFAGTMAAVIKGTLNAYLDDHAELLEISEQADYIIAAIDDASPRLFVARDVKAAAA